MLWDERTTLAARPTRQSAPGFLRYQTMLRILITGATGNVGRAVLVALLRRANLDIRAGVHDEACGAADLAAFPGIRPVPFDFADSGSQDTTLAGCDSVFLLRPSQLTDDLAELIARAGRGGVRHIVFLSVQGAEDDRFILHHKTELLLMKCRLAYMLLRPAYFEQNFTTTLRSDLVERHRIFLPAGRAHFALIDVGDIGWAVPLVLTKPGPWHHGQAYTLTAQYRLMF